MLRKKPTAALLITLAITMIFAIGLPAHSQETVLHSFNPSAVPKDGFLPSGTLVWDNAGVNLYGTTADGGIGPNCGSSGCGTVFELIAPTTPGGAWTEKILHNFGYGDDGANPQAGLIIDAAGNLYGTTEHGGAYVPTNTGAGGGTVFEMIAPTTPGGEWRETRLYSFGKTLADGETPLGGVIFGPDGYLYGTTAGGGTGTCTSSDWDGCGTVFQLSPRALGGWTRKTLHNFGTGKSDGVNPLGGVVFGPDGGLYGTTAAGGAYTGGPCDFQQSNGCGTVFELIPVARGPWPEKRIHNFKYTRAKIDDGMYPYAGVVFDNAGNLYGTTFLGGLNACSGISLDQGCGVVFELSPALAETWTETILHRFAANPRGDGFFPITSLTFNPTTGVLYGTTTQGGSAPGDGGTVFEFTPSPWTYSQIYSFNTVGFSPYGPVLYDSDGNLYGTTLGGGATGGGIAFEITP